MLASFEMQVQFCRPLNRYSFRSKSLFGRFAKGFGAYFAGTKGAQVLVAEDPGGMPVIENDLDRIVPNLGGGIGAGLGLVHGQQRRSRKIERGRHLFFAALVIACGAGALVAQIGKIEVAGVSVSPSDIHAGTGLHVNFHLGGFFALVEWCGHGKSL
jgi:hypothetical protein